MTEIDTVSPEMVINRIVAGCLMHCIKNRMRLPNIVCTVLANNTLAVWRRKIGPIPACRPEAAATNMTIVNADRVQRIELTDKAVTFYYGGVPAPTFVLITFIEE